MRRKLVLASLGLILWANVQSLATENVDATLVNAAAEAGECIPDPSLPSGGSCKSNVAASTHSGLNAEATSDQQQHLTTDTFETSTPPSAPVTTEAFPVTSADAQHAEASAPSEHQHTKQEAATGSSGQLVAAPGASNATVVDSFAQQKQEQAAAVSQGFQELSSLLANLRSAAQAVTAAVDAQEQRLRQLQALHEAGGSPQLLAASMQAWATDSAGLFHLGAGGGAGEIGCMHAHVQNVLAPHASIASPDSGATHAPT